MAERMGMRFRDHELTIKGPGPDKKFIGKCSCGKWTGFNKSRDRLVTAWNKQHINKIDKWK